MEYSARFRVSLSTLRRRIKAGEIEYKFIEGKYLLKNGPLQPSAAATSPETIAPPTQASAQAPVAKAETAKSEPLPPSAAVIPPAESDQFWKTTQGLLNEIKKAYSLILQEKEEQVLQLKEEVADLKTLVRVLEDENTRLKRSMPSQDFDLGLEA
jgi:hypothetical protein